MTRKDYVLLADAVFRARAQTPGSPNSPAFLSGVDTVAAYIAEALASQSAGFDATRFMHAAGVPS